MDEIAHDKARLIREVETCIRRGLFPEALGKSSRLMAIAPKDYLALTLHAKVLRRLGRTLESLKFFSEASRIYFLRIEELHQYAVALMESDKLEAAAKYFAIVRKRAQLFANEAGEFGAYAQFRVDGKKIAEVHVDGEILYFHVLPGEQNLGESLYHASGKLREMEELSFVREKVRPGGVVIDVGANIGSTVVYFAKFLKPLVIVPIEPNPEAVSQLKANIAANKINCIDDRFLGIGAGEKRERVALVKTPRLVTCALEPAEAGELEVRSLDEIVDSAVDFIKIDVEGMELAVLRGARRVISQYHPQIMIEVRDEHDQEFKCLLEEFQYRVERGFRRHRYKNYFISSRE